MYAACYVSNRQVYMLSRIYSSHILNMVIIHDAHWPCSPLTSVPVARYINIMILIIGAHNVTPDLWSVLHNVWLMYTTYVQHAHNQHAALMVTSPSYQICDGPPTPPSSWPSSGTPSMLTQLLAQPHCLELWLWALATCLIVWTSQSGP